MREGKTAAMKFFLNSGNNNLQYSKLRTALLVGRSRDRFPVV